MWMWMYKRWAYHKHIQIRTTISDSTTGQLVSRSFAVAAAMAFFNANANVAFHDFTSTYVARLRQVLRLIMAL